MICILLERSQNVMSKRGTWTRLKKQEKNNSNISTTLNTDHISF